MIANSVVTDFTPNVCSPKVDPTAYVHPLGFCGGCAVIGKRVLVSPCASVRGDEGQAVIVDDESNVQDGCVIHGLETESHGKPTANRVTAPDGSPCSVYVGKRVSMAHQSQVHGPARVGDDTFIGMQVLVFKAEVGNNCVVEPGCTLLGVKVPDGRYVPMGTVLSSQADADALPKITDDYPFKKLNAGVVHVNTSLADGYNKEQPYK